METSVKRTYLYSESGHSFSESTLPKLAQCRVLLLLETEAYMKNGILLKACELQKVRTVQKILPSLCQVWISTLSVVYTHFPQQGAFGC